MSTEAIARADAPLRRPRRRVKWGLIATYAIVIAITLTMLTPFVWMISASFKLDRDVFAFPIQWMPEHRAGRTMSRSGPRFRSACSS